jgi:ankyrin repeat protein
MIDIYKNIIISNDWENIKNLPKLSEKEINLVIEEEFFQIFLLIYYKFNESRCKNYIKKNKLHRKLFYFLCSYCGNYHILYYIFPMISNIKNFFWTKDMNAFNLAAAGGHVNIMKFLINKKVSIYTRNNQDQNAYTIAILNGHLHVLEYLDSINFKKIYINYDFDINKNTGYMNACILGNLSIIKYFENAGYVINYKNYDGPLKSFNDVLTVCTFGHLEVLKYFYSVKDKIHRDFGAINFWGNNAFLLAAIYGHIDIMDFLLSVLYDFINSLNNVENNAFMEASVHGRINVMKYLLNKNIYNFCPFSVKNMQGNNCSLLASYYKKIRVLNYIETLGKFSKQSVNDHNMNILSCAIEGSKNDNDFTSKKYLLNKYYKEYIK